MPGNPAKTSGNAVVSFTVPGWHPGDAGDILSGSYDIICRTGLHCSPMIMENLGMEEGTIRLSLSRFTEKADATGCWRLWRL